MNNFKGFTIFVDGLPYNMNSRWLKNIFNSQGDITDVYVSFKKRKSSSNVFGFVRFQRKDEAERAISNLDGKEIYKNYLKVRWSRFRREAKAFNGSQHNQKVVRCSSCEIKEDLFLASFEKSLDKKFDNFKKNILNQIQEIINIATSKSLQTHENLLRGGSSPHGVLNKESTGSILTKACSSKVDATSKSVLVKGVGVYNGDFALSNNDNREVQGAENVIHFQGAATHLVSDFVDDDEEVVVRGENTENIKVFHGDAVVTTENNEVVMGDSIDGVREKDEVFEVEEAVNGAINSAPQVVGKVADRGAVLDDGVDDGHGEDEVEVEEVDSSLAEFCTNVNKSVGEEQCIGKCLKIILEDKDHLAQDKSCGVSSNEYNMVAHAYALGKANNECNTGKSNKEAGSLLSNPIHFNTGKSRSVTKKKNRVHRKRIAAINPLHKFLGIMPKS